MIPILQLTKEERINEIILDIDQKINAGQIMGAVFVPDSSIDSDELQDILNRIEHRIYYITPSPVFSFDVDGVSKMLSSGTYECSTIDELVDLITITNPNMCFIWYNLSKHDGRFRIRGVFIDDRAKLRNNKIDEILN